MTSRSDFQVNDVVWEAFAWIYDGGTPKSIIRRAVVERACGDTLLLRFDDGRVDYSYTTSVRKVCPTRLEAVAHCTASLAEIRRRIEEELERLLDEPHEEHGGPARSGIASAGTAPPEVAW